MAEIRDLREQYGKVIKDAKDYWDVATSLAAKENRSVTDAENEKFDAMMDDGDKLQATIEQEEATHDRLNRVAAAQEYASRPVRKPTRADPPVPPIRASATAPTGDLGIVPDTGKLEAGQHYERFSAYLKRGTKSRLGREFHTEYFDLSATDDEGGGYIVAPEQFADRLIKFVDDDVYMRQLVRERGNIFVVSKAESLGAPSLDTDVGDADWMGENETLTFDTSLKFGKRALHPHPQRKGIKVSNSLLEKATFDVATFIGRRLAYKMAITQEKAFFTGSGAQQPLGIFTASDQGISTGRDISTGNTTTTIGADGLHEALGSLKAQYADRATWIFHRKAITQIRKLKAGTGEYLFREGLSMGLPNTILGRPYKVSELAPDTFTNGEYVGIVGDIGEGYWIADVGTIRLQRSDERYIEENNVAFIVRFEVDGMPVLEEAFARVTLA